MAVMTGRRPAGWPRRLHPSPPYRPQQGRDPADADLMKPHPHLLNTAIIALGAAASESVYVGDAVTDVAAASAAGMPCIGYANKPGKAQRLKESGAALVTTDMSELAGLL
jgi:beta-phosphoglucomutase-like phosphatase (HAD superfamily)